MCGQNEDLSTTPTTNTYTNCQTFNELNTFLSRFKILMSDGPVLYNLFTAQDTHLVGK